MANGTKLISSCRARMMINTDQAGLRKLVNDGTLQAVKIGPRTLRINERSVFNLLGIEKLTDMSLRRD